MAGNLALSESASSLSTDNRHPTLQARLNAPASPIAALNNHSASSASGIALNIGSISSLGQLRQALSNNPHASSAGNSNPSSTTVSNIIHNVSSASNSLLSQQKTNLSSTALAFQPIGTMSVSAANSLATTSKSAAKTSFIAVPKSVLSSVGQNSLIPSFLTSISTTATSSTSGVQSLIVASPSMAGKPVGTKHAMGVASKMLPSCKMATLVQTSAGPKLLHVTQKYDRKPAANDSATGLERDKVQAIQKMQFHDFPLTTAALTKTGSSQVMTQAKILSKRNIEFGQFQPVPVSGDVSTSTSNASTRVKSLLITTSGTTSAFPVTSTSMIPQFAQLSQSSGNKTILTLASPIRKVTPHPVSKPSSNEAKSGTSIIATSSLQPRQVSVALNRGLSPTVTTQPKSSSASLLSTALSNARQTFTPIKVIATPPSTAKQVATISSPQPAVSKVRIQLPSTSAAAETTQSVTAFPSSSSPKASTSTANVSLTGAGDKPVSSHAVLAGADAEEQQRVLEAAHILLLTSGLVTMRENKKQTTSGSGRPDSANPVTTMILPSNRISQQAVVPSAGNSTSIQPDVNGIQINSVDKGEKKNIEGNEEEISIVYSDVSETQSAATMAVRSHHSYSRQPSVTSGRGRKPRK